MNAPVSPFPCNPTVGQVYQGWVWNGACWVSTGGGPNLIVRAFTASGTYWPSAGMVSAVVECIGGGGAGGSAQCSLVGNATTVAFTVTGGGGGSGSYARKAMAAALVSAGVPVTIGAGGASNGGNGSAAPLLSGGNGGTTSFGAYCSAVGGQGGYGNTAQYQTGNVVQTANWGVGGGNPGGSVGDVVMEGTSGWHGDFEYVNVSGTYIQVAVFGGHGAPGPWGGSLQNPNPMNAVPGGSTNNGQGAWTNTGSGGSGGGATAENVNTGIGNGGAGGSGLCIVTEWCLASTSAASPCNPPPGCGPWSPSWGC